MIPEGPAAARRGRGSVANPAGRYEPRRTEAFDDGWGTVEAPEGRVETTVTIDATRTILAENDSPDVPFDRSINPYRGCEHGCAYCFARPSHAWLGMSSGLDFETRILAKPAAADLLRREIGRARYRCTPIALGSNTDPYQPVERRFKITRSVLEVLAAHDHPVSIVTKSAGVLRDLDLLAPMAVRGLASVCLSVTTLDPALAKALEPRAAAPSRRLETVRALADAGVPCAVLVSPVIPALNDAEIESIVEAAAAAGARAAWWLLVRLPHDLKDLFRQWLEVHRPTLAARVLARIRDLRGGRLNDSRFGRRVRGQGPYADLIRDRFEVARRRHGLADRLPPLDTTRFRPPARVHAAQRSLFGGR